MRTVEERRKEYFHVRSSGFWGAVIVALVILGCASVGTYWKAVERAQVLVSERISDQVVEDFLRNADGAKQIVISAFPVGSIIAWHKNMPGTPPLPEGGPWVECNGQELDDPAYEGSRYYGKKLPNLNHQHGGLFLRGGRKSGTRQDASAVFEPQAESDDGSVDAFSPSVTPDDGVVTISKGYRRWVAGPYDDSRNLTRGDLEVNHAKGRRVRKRPVEPFLTQPVSWRAC